MKKCLCLILIGIGLGLLIGYNYEDEIDDSVHNVCRCKRKMMRKMHQISK